MNVRLGVHGVRKSIYASLQIARERHRIVQYFGNLAQPLGGHGVVQGSPVGIQSPKAGGISYSFLLAHGPWKVSPQSCVMEIHARCVRGQHEETAVLTLSPHTRELAQGGSVPMALRSGNWVAHKMKQTTP